MLQNTISKYMKHESHDQNIKYFVSFVDEMVMKMKNLIVWSDTSIND